MTSRSATYLRSVSTSSRRTWFRSRSPSAGVAADEDSKGVWGTPDRKPAEAGSKGVGSEGGDGGASSGLKCSWGTMSTSFATVSTTFCARRCPLAFKPDAGAPTRSAHLDKTIRIPGLRMQLGDRKDLVRPIAAVLELREGNDELGGRPLALLDVVQVNFIDIGVNVNGFSARNEVPEEDERVAEEEAVPDLTDGVGGVALAIAACGNGRCEDKEGSKAVYPDKLGSELGAALVEGGRGGGGFVEELI